MMTKKSERLKLIIDLQLGRERDALKMLGTLQQRLLAVQSQLDNLRNMRFEYQQKVEERQSAGINVSQLLEFRSFADKLGQAINTQETLVLSQEMDLQRARLFWEECHQRYKNLKKLGEQARLEELNAENRREQLEQDERAARSSRKNGIGNA
jgi:flagellar FliJ protein